MAAHLRGIAADVGSTPTALLVISAHWEGTSPIVNTGAQPGMLFDYYGFPEHTYALNYPSPGSPGLAARVKTLLDDAGIACDEDPARGHDHGVFVPLLLMFPEARVPWCSCRCKPVSIRRRTWRSAARSRRCAMKAC